eukprot:c16809_g1_i2.p1 GENE.c16809_g1_i2~~c16809_g1_i2.p1  ORF type:complete len:545 (+),score=80.30 c16809_g1_i2:49-1635(+)
MSGESDYDLSELTIIINELSEHAILPFLEKLHEYFKQSKSTMSSRAKCDHAQVHQILAEVHGSNLEPHLDMMIEDIIECLCDPQPLVQGAAADAFAVLVCLASKDVETTVDKVADALIHQMICKDGGRQEVAASGIITVAQKLWEKKPVLLDYIYRLLLKTAPHVETSEGQGLIFDCLATLAEIDESTSIRHCAQLVSCWSKLLSLHDDGISLVVVSNVANISEAFGTKLLSETELATDLINHLEECCEAPELYEHANHALGTLLRLSNALEKQNAEDDAPRRAIPPPKYVPQMPKVLPSKVAPTTMPNQTIAPSQSQLPWQDSQKQILSSDKSAFHHPARQSPDPVTGRRGGTSPISAIPSAYIARIRQAQYAKTEQRSSTPGSSPSQEQNLAQSIAHLSESLRELMAITQDGFTQMTKRIERLEEAFGSLSSRMTPDRPWKSSPTQLQSQSSFSVAQRPAIGGFNIDTSVQSARQTPVLAASLPPKSIVLTGLNVSQVKISLHFLQTRLPMHFMPQCKQLRSVTSE